MSLHIENQPTDAALEPTALEPTVLVETPEQTAAAVARRMHRGMSLLEIMVVITLIGLVTAAVGVAVMGQLEDGQMKTARNQAFEIEKSLDIYKLQHGTYPSSAQGLGVLSSPPKGKAVMERVPKDPWGNSYAMVEALRELSVEKVALNAAYHWPEWWRGTVGFLREAGFDVLWAGNFHDQGWFDSQDAINDCRWVFDGDLAMKSFRYVADRAPEADAYLINGMCNFRRASDGLAQRPVSLEVEIETMLGKPMISHDNALYWRMFKTLGIAPATSQGRLLSSLANKGHA